MSTSADAVRRWRMCSAPSARYRPREKIRHTRPIPRTPGTVSSAASALRDQRVDEAARPLVMRVQEPRRLCAGEHAAVQTDERDPLGLASRPTERLERRFSSRQMRDHLGGSVTRARSAWR